MRLCSTNCPSTLKRRRPRPITSAVSTGSSFRFRLERVRALRERRTDAARQELARALGSLGDSRARLRDADAELQRALAAQRCSGAAARAIDARQLHAHQAYAERIEAQRSARREELVRREAAVSERTDELARAARSQHTLERLKERRRAEHEREAGRRESAALDEIAIERFRRSAA